MRAFCRRGIAMVNVEGAGARSASHRTCPSRTQQLCGKSGFDLLLHAWEHRYLDRAEAPQRRDDVVDQFLGCRSPGGDPDHRGSPDPRGVEFTPVGDEVARYAGFDPDLTQAVRVRAILPAHDKNHIGDLGQLAHGGLPVLGRVADVVDVRPDDVGEASLQRGDDRSGIVDAQRRLRYVRDGRVDGEIQCIDVALGLHQQYRSRYLAHRALDLRMARVADQDQNTPLRRVAFALAMDLGDERTGCIQNAQSIFLRFVLDLPCDPLRTENGDSPRAPLRPD